MDTSLPSNVSFFLSSLNTTLLPPSVTLIATHTDYGAILMLRANHALTKAQLHTASYDKPRIFAVFHPSAARNSSQLSFLAFQTAEFALPIRASDTNLRFNYFSRPAFTRPHTFFPLIIYAKTACCLLAPLDTFHEQILIADGDQLNWGWNGDLEQLPSSFCSRIAIIVRPTTKHALTEWAHLLNPHPSPITNPSTYKHHLLSRLTYWTDNGAAYWYRTEKGLTLPETLARTIAAIEQSQFPIAAVEIDSWFYPHQKTRPISDVGYLNVVPPTGMLRWEPRKDVFGEGGLNALKLSLGNKPLILHSRHISSSSSYVQQFPNDNWWIDGDRAHPEADTVFRKWMADAKNWGATAYEQDWIVEVWLGVRHLRSEQGRIATWQKQLDDAAGAEGLSLIWCMATPADMMLASTLTNVVCIRSCDDYRYAEDASILWRWHLTTSHLISALGLCPFKDVFMTCKKDSGIVDIDGDPNAELEACLAVMSTGPVGIGDRLTRTDPNLISKCCREDGLIVKPSAPMTAIEYSMRDANGFLWAETHSDAWQYILVVRTGLKSNADPLNDIPMTERLTFAKSQQRLIYDWRCGVVSISNHLEASLQVHEWKLWIVCPVWRREKGADTSFCSIVGDPTKFATMGAGRIEVEWKFQEYEKDLLLDVEKTSPTGTETDGTDEDHVWRACEKFSGELRFDLVGRAGEIIDIVIWSNKKGLVAKSVTIPATERQALRIVYIEEENGYAVRSA